MGHALVIPLCDTIQQITYAFNAKSVCLPQEAKSVSIVDPVSPEGRRRRRQITLEPRLEGELLPHHYVELMIAKPEHKLELGSQKARQPHRCSSRPKLPESSMTEAVCTDLGTPQQCPPRSAGTPVVAFPRSSPSQISARPPCTFLPEEVRDEPGKGHSIQNLVEFWETTRPPTTVTGSLMLWTSLSRLAGALHVIQHTCSDGSPR